MPTWASSFARSSTSGAPRKVAGRGLRIKRAGISHLLRTVVREDDADIDGEDHIGARDHRIQVKLAQPGHGRDELPDPHDEPDETLTVDLRQTAVSVEEL